ncbi:helix-turn-helix domain-containing protein [Brevundimonas fontaquae]|uniref:Helix-turn-helix transcriptional regulator n=1 Tax=Brevundimonas fontaquae TaxID=2813778 RepID=A0ABX7LTU4_9CAUL|nr:helix-turn-helix transcriptional regulator [Brevundimonas fontaquae]QSF55762.1 helix-turn-helix transcriptional regulator [Brevundimonas fontaquae]
MGLAGVFGTNVRRRRLDRGITLEALAHDVGLSYSYVGELERGRRNPTLKVVERIARALEVDALVLLQEEVSQS